MANFFGEIFKRAGDLVSHPVKISKDLITHPSKGWHELTHLYTHNEHKDQDLFQKGFGIHGWVGKHPQESAAAVVATIFGGWAAWGAYGAGAAGGAAGTAGTAAGGTAAGAGAGAGGSGIAAGTVIGQTVPATPGMIAAANGGGAAIGTGANAVSAGYAATATPSMEILAGSGYGVGGSYATTLGGEAQFTNTGLVSDSWGSKAKQYYDNYQRVKQFTEQGQSEQQQSTGPQLTQQQIIPFQQSQGRDGYALPQAITGINLTPDQNNVPSFTNGGSFGGFNR